MRIWIPIVLLGLGLTTLLTVGILYGGIPELQVREVLAGSAGDGEVKLHGIIHKIHSDVRPLRFTIRDKQDSALFCEVEVEDARPDIFKENTDVAVRGVFSSEKRVMRATWISTKCPSKYEASKETEGGAAPVPANGAGSG